jgi:hypothetical protein
MYKYLALLLLVNCGTNTEVPSKPVKPKIELVIENKDFKPLLGNENLFAGLLCSSGEKEFCKAVYDNIAPNGDFCRNETRVTSTGCSDKTSSFSYDEFLGVMLFILANKDKNLANKFYASIKNNQICNNPIAEECFVFPFMYGIMYHVWNKIGLKPNGSMVAGSYGEDAWQKVASTKVAVGFRTHLIMTWLYIRRLTNTWNTNTQAIAKTLTARQENNLFAQYLATGSFDKKLFLHYYSQRTPKMRQWHQQRSDAEESWRQSVGFDFEFLMNLYNRE